MDLQHFISFDLDIILAQLISQSVQNSIRTLLKVVRLVLSKLLKFGQTFSEKFRFFLNSQP